MCIVITMLCVARGQRVFYASPWYCPGIPVIPSTVAHWGELSRCQSTASTSDSTSEPSRGQMIPPFHYNHTVTMNKKLVDTGLKSFVETIKTRLPRCGVRITVKRINYQSERLRIVFPIPDKNTGKSPRARIETVNTFDGNTINIEIKSPVSSTARLEIVSTPGGYTYRVWLETPARILELANPGVYEVLEGICDAIYKLATNKRGTPDHGCGSPV